MHRSGYGDGTRDNVHSQSKTQTYLVRGSRPSLHGPESDPISASGARCNEGMAKDSVDGAKRRLPDHASWQERSEVIAEY